MRSDLFVVLAALLLPYNSFAQVPSIVESGALQADTHSWRKVLRNQSPSSLVAYKVGCIPESGLGIVSDALIDGGSFVDPGKSIEVQVNDPATCEAGVRAAIFSDGHAEGKPEFVNELFAYRRGAHQALGDTIKVLASVGVEKVTPISGMRFVRSMVEENICPCSVGF